MPLTFNNRRRTLYIAAESTEGTFVGKTTLFVIGDAVVPSESIKPEYNVERTERTVDNRRARRSQPSIRALRVAFRSPLA